MRFILLIDIEHHGRLVFAGIERLRQRDHGELSSRCKAELVDFRAVVQGFRDDAVVGVGLDVLDAKSREVVLEDRDRGVDGHVEIAVLNLVVDHFGSQRRSGRRRRRPLILRG